MENKLAQLKSILAEVYDLENTAHLLEWDMQTYMPPGGSEARGYQLGTVMQIAHEKFTSPEVGELLEDLAPLAAQLPPDSDDARLIQVTQRRYTQKTKDSCQDGCRTHPADHRRVFCLAAGAPGE